MTSVLAFLLARALAAAAAFVGMSLYTRLLSPAQYGQYALVVAGAALAGSVGLFWLRLGLLRFHEPYAGEPQRFRVAILTGLLAFMAASAVAGLGLALWLRRADLAVLIALGALLLWGQSWVDVNLDLCVARRLVRRYGALSSARAGLSLLGGVALALAGFGAIGVLVGTTLGYLLPGAWLAWSDWRRTTLLPGSGVILQQLARYGLPLTATYALEYVVSSSDRFFLAHFAGAAAVGVYAVSYDLVQQGLATIMGSVNLSAYPRAVAAMERGGAAGARAYMLRHGTLLAGIALPAAAGLAVLAPNVAGVLLGSSFREGGARIMPWICGAALLSGFKAYYYDLAFQLGRRTVRQIWPVAAAALLNALLNILLIPRAGMMGAVYATVLAYALSLSLSVLLGRAALPLSLPWANLARIALAVGAMAAVLALLRQYQGAPALVVQVASGFGVYGLVLLVLDVGGLRSSVLERLRGVRGGSPLGPGPRGPAPRPGPAPSMLGSERDA